ncbi:MAG: hypothetical protein AUH91_01755 [Verrucomicrobia bacterium 13_1_40CM_4_54_4]|nr:MAG: hypothetical protein AUH91_01755 [Verrucomicrobia bacterium 13_1_40CM_4_54_4]PYJ51535.1 MAG: hypothetical protein DME87_02925 [Verrucomicrobiota bacterium]
MKVHLKQIPTEGLHLEGDEECPIPELETDGIRCVGPLHYNVDLGVAGGALWASGLLSQPVELRCVSCLEKFVHEVQVPAFAVHTELRGPETVDLTPFMREDLLLNLPAHPHCDRDAGRICKPKQIETAEQEMKRESDWSALDKLKLKG